MTNTAISPLDQPLGVTRSDLRVIGEVYRKAREMSLDEFIEAELGIPRRSRWPWASFAATPKIKIDLSVMIVQYAVLLLIICAVTYFLWRSLSAAAKADAAEATAKKEEKGVTTRGSVK